MESNQYVLFPIPKDELIDLLGKIIDQRLERFLGSGSKQETDREELLTIDQASSFLGISKQTLYGYSSKRIVPCMKKGRKLFFSKSELTDWVKQSKKKTLLEIEKEVEQSTSKR